MAKYLLAGVEYSSKQAVRDRADELYAKYRGLTHLLAGDEEAFARDLWVLHPRGCSARQAKRLKFYVKPSEYGRSWMCFGVQKGNAAPIYDYGHNEALTPRKPQEKLAEAYRKAVVDQVVQFRKQFFASHHNPRCPVTGDRLYPDGSRSHVDHEPPHTFANLVRQFNAQHKVDATKPIPKQKLAQLQQLFADFHRRHAHLRVITKEANLSKVT